MTLRSQWLARTALIAFGLAGALGGCIPIVDNRGNAPPPEAIAEIKVGATRTQVQQLLGSPSNVGTFTDKTWYYISRRTETEAFFAPHAVDQQIITVRFDDTGVVTEVTKVTGLEQTVDVTPVSDVTPTAGHSLGLLEQLFGDVGRFSGLPGAGSNGTNPGGRGGGNGGIPPS